MLQRGSQEKRETMCCCGEDDEPAFVISGWGGIPRSMRWGLYYAGGGEEVGNTKPNGFFILPAVSWHQPPLTPPVLLERTQTYSTFDMVGWRQRSHSQKYIVRGGIGRLEIG